jgi:hypothetical protein
VDFAEIHGTIDSVGVPQRSVWYWAQFQSHRSARTEDHATAVRWAQALAEEHGTCVVDYSDRGTGYLRAALAGE